MVYLLEAALNYGERQQQKLMRHAHISTTMDRYGNASIEAKRKANRPVIQRLLRRPAAQPVSIQ